MRTNKHRLRNLETVIRPRTHDEGLSADERAVLCVALVRKLLPVWRSRQGLAQRGTGTTATALPATAFSERIRSANGRVSELAQQGRLAAVVKRLKTLGRWRDDKAI